MKRSGMIMSKRVFHGKYLGYCIRCIVVVPVGGGEYLDHPGEVLRMEGEDRQIYFRNVTAVGMY